MKKGGPRGGENRLLRLFPGRLLSPTPKRSRLQLVPVRKTFVFEIKTQRTSERFKVREKEKKQPAWESQEGRIQNESLREQQSFRLRV